MATETRTFVDTDVLIDIARKNLRALDFWRRAEARSTMTCSVISVFEVLAGCRNLREQQATLESYRNEILTKSPRNFAALAEGPLEQLRQLQRQVDEYIQKLGAAGTPASA